MDSPIFRIIGLAGFAGLLAGAATASAQSFATTPVSVNVPGGTSTGLLGLNDNGVLVGTNNGHGVIVNGLSKTVWDAPGAAGTRINGINRSGQLAGAANISGTLKCFVTTAGGSTQYFDPGTFGSCTANGLNNAGDVVGQFVDGVGDTHAFLWRGGPMSGNPVELIGYPGGAYSSATGINDAGDIAGWFSDGLSTHAFVLRRGVYTRIDGPGAIDTLAFGINNHGQVVGSYTHSFTFAVHGFLWDNGFISTFDETVLPSISGINSLGQIVGGGVFGTPTPARSVSTAFSGSKIPNMTVVRTNSDGSLNWYAQGALSVTWGVIADVPVPGFYDGGLQSVVAVWRPSNGVWYIRHTDGTSASVAWGSGSMGDIPVPADYDGDGKTDLAVWRPGKPSSFFILESGGPAVRIDWGTFGDVPVVADYDGDGRADLAVWRPSTGYFYVIPSSGAPAYALRWGTAGDQPVVGDFDGDRKADFAVVRHTDQLEWFIRRSSDGRVDDIGFGLPTDLPLAGDFDGDGKIDIAVWRPGAQSRFYAAGSATRSVISVDWGGRNDLPITR
jgi:probable HAF family extracellular repeat protein